MVTTDFVSEFDNRQPGVLCLSKVSLLLLRCRIGHEQNDSHHGEIPEFGTWILYYDFHKFSKDFFNKVNCKYPCCVSHFLFVLPKLCCFSSFAHRASTADQRYWIVQLSHLHPRAEYFPQKITKFHIFQK